MPNLVLTGLPRSGSTLTCHLLNRCADTVALHEPIPMGDLAKEFTGRALVGQVARFYEETRESLLERRTAISKKVDGKVPDNTFGDLRGKSDPLRRSLASRGEVSFEGKELSADFTLAIKHNAGFAALLVELEEEFTCRGIIRHPLAVLASWNSVQLPVQQGHIPVGEAIDTALYDRLAAIEDRTERQFYILEWFFERFERVLGPERMLRYEDLIASGGKSLRIVTPAAERLDEPLASKNKNSAYDAAQIVDLGERLLGRAGAFWNFYTRESVEEMLAAARQGTTMAP